MPNGASVRIEGASNLRRTCKAAGVDITQLKEAHGEASNLVARIARPRTPRLTGRLAASVRSSGTKTAAIVRAGGAAIPYAAVIHYGWPARGIAAQPWLTQTATDTQPQWLDIDQHGVQRVLNTIRGK